MNNKFQKGVSLYLTISILAILTSISLTLVSISISQIKVVWTVGDSVLAFYAADAGMEQALYRIRREGNLDNFQGGFANGSSFIVVIDVGENKTTVESAGSFHNTKRALEVTY